ncbi:hypothetical protein [Constantimarinum furrinae]|uniref:Uncharacterized protein n=1 Tax=Constantimarinum furrinae TaxID=2562285 RepID=A0A7G8PVG5_9FLAO|nr:hypothetical protein [Constantimarinum furrinae]QNJ98331.1 hypothetical protein ALE3EI_1782 [Constantimarinum furrinae]
MKKLRLILAAFGLILTTTLTAATKPVAVVSSPTSTEIGELLQNPNFLVEQEMQANVTFVLNKDNEIVVLSVDTDNDTVDRYVKNRLNYQKLNVSLKQGTAYKVPIRITSVK